jgi:hypothetical protein
MAIVFKINHDHLMSLLTKNSINQNKINEIMMLKSKENVKTEKKEETKTLLEKDKQEIILDSNIINQLLWCFYILKNGYVEFSYKYANNQNQINEINIVGKQLSVKYVDIFEDKEIKKKLKMNKMTNIGMIKTNLCYDDVMSMDSFLALCLVNNIRIMVLMDEYKYFSLLLDDEQSKVNNVLYISKGKYKLDINNKKENDELVMNRIKVDKASMKLDVISKYTAKELREMYDKIVPNEYKKDEKGKRMLKKDIYNMVLEYY